MTTFERARRELLYCALGSLAGIFGFYVVALTIVPGLALSATIIMTVAGLLLVTVALRLAVRVGSLHRRLLARMLGETVPPPAPFQPGTGVLGRLDRRLRYRPAWRAIGFSVVKMPVSALQGYAVAIVICGLVDLTYPVIWVLFRHHSAGTSLSPLTVAAPAAVFSFKVYSLPATILAALAGAVWVLAGVWLARGAIAIDRRLIRGLLGPSTLTERVSELERTRALAVDDSAAALRRVERDLHDGAQMRLAALAMNLGMAQEKLGTGSTDTGTGTGHSGTGTGRIGGTDTGSTSTGGTDTGPGRTGTGGTEGSGTSSTDGSSGPPVDLATARELIAAAHRNAVDALADLRDIARGIHPPALDNGLAVALESLAASSAIPVTLVTGLDPARRPSPAIETIAYFCAAELIANATKHSYANQIKIEIKSESAGVLRLRISDDGVGGADKTRGSGLEGLEQRVSTVDGRLDLSSPSGGPTVVTVDLPLRASGESGNK